MKLPVSCNPLRQLSAPTAQADSWLFINAYKICLCVCVCVQVEQVKQKMALELKSAQKALTEVNNLLSYLESLN